MLVTLDFEVDGNEYRVERGRKPNLFKFYVNAQEQEMTDESQGDSRQTQLGERVTAIKNRMKNALSTYQGMDTIDGGSKRHKGKHTRVSKKKKGRKSRHTKRKTGKKSKKHKASHKKSNHKRRVKRTTRKQRSRK